MVKRSRDGVACTATGKTCKACHITKPLVHFSGAGTGYSGKCKKCQIAEQRAKGKPCVTVSMIPELMRFWDTDLNTLDPETTTYGSNELIHWLCSETNCEGNCTHRWCVSPKDMKKGKDKYRNCPLCTGTKICVHTSLAAKRPDLAAQWDHERNDTTPEETTYRSGTKVSWICPKVTCTEGCQHRFLSEPHTRTKSTTDGLGCPFCDNKQVCIHNSLLVKRPDLAAELHPIQKKGISATTLAVQSNKEVRWLCPEQHPDCTCGHVHDYPAIVENRTNNGTGCPFCQGRATCRCRSFGARFPEIAVQMDTGMEQPDPFTLCAYSHERLWFKCPKHGSWRTVLSTRTHGGCDCPGCVESKMERDAARILEDMGLEFETQFQFGMSSYRFDAYVKADVRFLVELDGSQHFVPCAFGSKKEGAAEKNFAAQRKNDGLKDNLARDNRLPLLRIPWTRARVQGNKHCHIREDIVAFQQLIKRERSVMLWHSDAEPYNKRDETYG
jgi:hypothetical protein